MKKNKQTSISLFLALLFICSSYSTFLYSSEKNIKKNILFIKRKRKERETKKMPIIDHPNKKQKHYSNNISNDNISNDNSSDKDEIGDFLHLPQSTENIQKYKSLKKRKRKRKKEKNKKQKLSSNNSSNNKLDNKSNDNSSDRDKICKFFNMSKDIEDQDLFTKIVKKLDLYNTHKIETIEISNTNNSSNREKICKFFNIPRNTKNRQLFVEIVKYLDPYNKDRIKKIETNNSSLNSYLISYLAEGAKKNIEYSYEKILLILQGKIQLDIKKILLRELKLPLDSNNETFLSKLQERFNCKYDKIHHFTKPRLGGRRSRKDIYKNILQRLQDEDSSEYESSSEEDDSPILVTL